MAVRLAQDIVLSIRHIFHHKQLNSSKTGISKYSVLPLSHACKCCKVSSRHFFFKPHSQTIAARQPSVLSWYSTFWSRATLRANLFCQKSVRVLGKCAAAQPSCWCQKQPLIKMTAWYFFNTKSGEPGSFLLCNLKRKPCRCSADRTHFSGRVFLLRMAAIVLERAAESIRSAIIGQSNG